MENEGIQLQLSTDEINLVLEGLGSMPFVKVFTLIGKVQQQAASQIKTVADTSETAKVTAK